MYDAEISEYLRDLADTYDVSFDVVCMLYQMMPDELYDGLVTTLEDMC